MIENFLHLLKENWEIIVSLSAVIGAALSPWSKLFFEKITRHQLTEEDLELAKIKSNDDNLIKMRDYIVAQHQAQQEALQAKYKVLEEENLILKVNQVRLESELGHTKERLDELKQLVSELKASVDRCNAEREALKDAK